MTPSQDEYQDTAWNANLFRPLLIAALATSAAVGPLALLRGVSAGRSGFLLLLCLAAALEGIYTTRQFGRPQWRDHRGLAFRLGEVTLLLIAARLVSWAIWDILPTFSQLGLWLRHPSSFLDGPFILSSLLALLAWGLAVGITSDFLDLALHPDEIAAREGRGRGESRSQIRAFRATPRAEIAGRFAARWVWGGFLLVACAAFAGVSITTDERSLIRLGLHQLGLPPAVLAGLLGYFLAGLLLLSEARLATLRGQWYNEDLQIAGPVLRRWPRISLLALGLIAGLAALLPIGSTGWLAAILTTLIAFMMRVALFLSFLFTLLVSLLLFPLRFLRPTGVEGPVEPPIPPPDIPSQAEMARRLPDWLAGAAAWLVVAAILGYALFVFLRGRGLLTGQGAAWLARLQFSWRGRWRRLGDSTRQAVAVVAGRLRRVLAVRRGQPAPRTRPEALSPRERVRYFYLRFVRQAADRGLSRHDYTTPLEFARDLTQEWPDATEDVDDLTRAFVATR